MADDNKGILARLLTETWPAKAAGGILDALMLPGQVAGGILGVKPENQGRWSDVDEARQQATYGTMMNRAADLGGLMMLGASGAPAVPNSLGMGVRTAPRDNYLTDLSQYTKNLYRESNIDDALHVIPGSNVSAGYGPGGAARQFYADTPDLALGQGANKGVRVGYDAGAFEGKISQSKPMWQKMYEDGMGEYVAAPKVGADVRGAVHTIDIDRAALSAAPRSTQAQYNRAIEQMKANGWELAETPTGISLRKPQAR